MHDDIDMTVSDNYIRSRFLDHSAIIQRKNAPELEEMFQLLDPAPDGSPVSACQVSTGKNGLGIEPMYGSGDAQYSLLNGPKVWTRDSFGKKREIHEPELLSTDQRFQEISNLPKKLMECLRNDGNRRGKKPLKLLEAVQLNEIEKLNPQIPADWPPNVDEQTFKAFICNYSSPYGGMKGSCMASMFVEIRRDAAAERRLRMLG